MDTDIISTSSDSCRLVLLLGLLRRDCVVDLLHLPQVDVASCIFCYSRCYGNEKTTFLKASVSILQAHTRKIAH